MAESASSSRSSWPDCPGLGDELLEAILVECTTYVDIPIIFWTSSPREVCFELVDQSTHFGYAFNTLCSFFKGSSRLKPYFHFSIASTCLRHQCSSLSGDFCLIESCQQKQNLFSRDFFSPPFRTIQNGGDLVTWPHSLAERRQTEIHRVLREMRVRLLSTALNITVPKR